MNFIGTSIALSQDGFNAAVECVGTKPAELWAVITVETSGCGYFEDRRPQILYERHIFYKLTKGRFPISDINSPDAGGYAGGTAEYDRLARAILLDQDAAVRSASWGIGQVLGENFKEAGFSDATSMVTAMCGTEDAQVMAVCKFLTSNGLDSALRNHDWPGFAHGYNGPNYVQYSYDTKLLQNYQKYSVGPPPDLTIRAAQLMLKFLNYNTGGVDGLNGRQTESALKAFQTIKGLSVTGRADEPTMAALKAAMNPVAT
jgi:hypothetical protein